MVMSNIILGMAILAINKMNKMKRKMIWEWNWPTFWGWTSHINVFVLDLNIQRKGDHSPGIWLSFIVLNCKLLDFGYYNKYHEDNFIIV